MKSGKYENRDVGQGCQTLTLQRHFIIYRRLYQYLCIFILKQDSTILS